MRKFLMWSALAAVIGLALAVSVYWAYWRFYARFQPTVVNRDQAEIQQLLDEANWVSAGGGGAPLYLIAWRDCASCNDYQRDEFPLLRAAGVEPRIIMFARPDLEGRAQSTRAERATVAELWLTRDWTLFQRWMATPSRNWTAAGIPQADGDLARTAVVNAGRDMQEELERLLRASGLREVTYPLILWRDRDGFLKVCACADARSYAFIRDDLGAADSLPAQRGGAAGDPDTPSPLPYPDVPGQDASPPADEELPDIPPVPEPRPAPQVQRDQTRRPPPPTNEEAPRADPEAETVFY